MSACKWSLLCRGDEEPTQGSVDADDGARLVIGFDRGGRIAVDPGDDGTSVTVEGEMTLSQQGERDVRFAGGSDINPSSGITGVSGRLVFDLSKDAAVEVSGDVNPRTGEVQAGGKLTITF